MGLFGSCGWVARVSPRRGLQAPTVRQGDETPATLLSQSVLKAQPYKTISSVQLARAFDWRVSARERQSAGQHLISPQISIPRRLAPGSQARTARTRRRTWTEPTAEEAVQQQQEQRPGDSYQAVLCCA
ncbi:hypothetical protein CFIO01_04339 [Colletotrichum fioriniae PJ7]|uniref:Uncharacterized protein n=1 Tax=Colletotrichum fioriniae PJ7 TaxID=1445577 RepID=A0A010S0D7_9PEZI|nr:hypothetical protein CFIO01_04339 [Colletotrichum fioriniae PJ7]